MSPRAELLLPFISAAIEVLQAESGTEVQRGQLSLESSTATTKDVTVLVNLVGDLEGTVMYSMDFDMSLALVSQMMGEEWKEFDELAESGVGELGNIISGQAATKLSLDGRQVDISVPTVIVGRDATISTLDRQRLVVPLITGHGTMEIHLALKEA